MIGVRTLPQPKENHVPKGLGFWHGQTVPTAGCRRVRRVIVTGSAILGEMAAGTDESIQNREHERLRAARMQYIESSVIGLRSAVITLKHRTSALTFVLIPMVHVGEQTFFDDVTRRAADCDLIIAEGAPSRYAPAQAWLAGLRSDKLVDQLVALDLEATGVPVQWEFVPAAPVTGSDELRTRAADIGGAALMKLMGRFGNPLRLQNLEQADEHDDRLARGTGVFGRALHHLIFDSRDAQLVRTLDLLHTHRREHAERIAVVYGAAHIPAAVDHLCERLGYFVRDATWLMVASRPDA